jgi:molybdopterin/thiamine biosynthesis adenylyltransferase
MDTSKNPDAPLAPRFPRDQSFKVIGLGGVGSIVARYVAVFLASLREHGRLVLIDGDVFKSGNAARMLFRELGNKAEVLRDELAPALERSSLGLEAIPAYVGEESVQNLIQEGDVVLLCVDNHATRLTVARHMARLDNGILISGGNDGVGTNSSGAPLRGTYGNVQVHVRHEGRDLTPSLERFHPEIAKPKDHSPAEGDCIARIPSTPQVLFANLAAASAMCNALLLVLSGELHYAELGFDIGKGIMRPIDLPTVA